MLDRHCSVSNNMDDSDQTAEADAASGRDGKSAESRERVWCLLAESFRWHQ